MSAKILKRSARAAEPQAAGPAPAKVIDRATLLAHAEARQILEEAEARAAEVLERSLASAEETRKRAIDEGRARGLQEWQTRLAELAEARGRLVEETEPRIVELALQLAEKVLRRRLEAEPADLLPVVSESLQVLRGAGGSLVLRVHPGTAPALERSKRELLARDPRWRHLDVVADESMDPCGCRIESELGVIDVGVDTQIAALRRALLQGGGR